VCATKVYRSKNNNIHYIIAWLVSGYTINIPDSVMSLTFIAFGVSLPDVVASVLVCRDGKKKKRRWRRRRRGGGGGGGEEDKAGG
jgi:Ca2+/Na+ antiporter